MALLPLLGLAALTGLLAAWLTVLLLVFPAGPVPHGSRFPVRGPLHAAAGSVAAFAQEHLVSLLPPPSRVFENLGPDRFRREIFRNLRSSTDNHVDDVMGRRNAPAWAALSVYARTRVYGHVHRRLPFVVDNFVDHVHRELDDIVSPDALVQRYFLESPTHVGQVFLSAFGADLRAGLPLAALAGAGAGWLGSLVAPGEGWSLAWVMGGAALAGSLLVMALLCFPRNALRAWPFRMEGILSRRRRRFMRILARRLANEALAWRAVSGEMLHGAHAERVHLIMRREVSEILDTTLFKATLQLLIGPEALVAVRRSAIEKAMDVLATTPVSSALQESYRLEIERTLLHAADTGGNDEAYLRLWNDALRGAWKVIPILLALGAFGLGTLTDFVLA